MPDAFNQDELTNPTDTIVLFKPFIDLISSGINELALDSTLDLAKYIASEILNLPAIYSFANINEFCPAMATNKTQILHSLAKIIDYDVSTNEKISKQYVEWKKITQVESKKKLQFCKNLENL